jgi:hypothetical protein
MMQIENLQLLYGAAAPHVFSDLKSDMRQLIAMRKQLGVFAQNVPYGVV